MLDQTTQTVLGMNLLQQINSAAIQASPVSRSWVNWYAATTVQATADQGPTFVSVIVPTLIVAVFVLFVFSIYNSARS